MTWYENIPGDPNLTHTASYFYANNGNRFRKTVDIDTIAYLYNNEDIIKENINSDINDYIHSPGIDEPSIQIPYSSLLNPYYYYADSLGSIRQLTSNTGSILNQYRYGSWGELFNPFISQENSHNPFSYNARESSENHMLYYRARYYASSIKEFISKDIYQRAMHVFHYVSNEPIMNIDPYGEFKMRDCEKCDVKLNAEDPNEFPETTIAMDVGNYCKKHLNRITDISIRDCIKERCKNGIIECEDDCWTLYLMIGTSPGYTSTSRIRIHKWKWEHKTNTAHLCLNPMNRPPRRDIACIVIHEWAHTCGWKEGQNKGVPDEDQECRND
ncbi:MAG: hypothetical protein A2Y62_07545 [Candidatus Fischerbacteria bacterium RBG_13_37_8]|uniref:Tox-MPTase3 domain-containing protein n=1 Tax=Candidatus Fischerbacteria bacterium RBG_13_37_8 TaxID=1817863 RepID=A0A1F5VI84_9BACT|nr:MAG: hypothetical protein A2Y62_07545 [Candidatus Fischerbacteria bacterium RBG_13_37_8]